MTRKSRRLVLISIAVAVIGAAVGMTLYALRGDVSLFLTPSELARRDPPPGTALRIGGLVQKGSVVRSAGGLVSFEVTDGKRAVHVVYKGILPDLFREGQGVVAEGVLVRPMRFRADMVLAKHDERYMPASVVAALKKQGVWKEGSPGKPAPLIARSGQ
ncbi:MAG TPA: cytochrome c maturation protein CcmE [Beijerinckiaceae bacterium]|nr:cytochrome c maturation protein CcmE [Beijerinckiaceae bacterium]